MNLLPPAVLSAMTVAIPGIALIVWLASARRDKGTLAGFAVVAFGVAAALAQATESHVVLLHLTTFGGTAALLVMTVRRRVGGVLGVTTLVVGVAAAHGPADVVGALAGALAAALAVGVAIPLWGWLSPRPLRLDDLGPQEFGHDDLGLDGLGLGSEDVGPATSHDTSARGSVR